MDNQLLYTVTGLENEMNLRQYLKNVQKLSSRLIKYAARERKIEVNNKIEKLNYILHTGDIIKVDIQKEESQDIIPEVMELEIAYEDSDLVIVNKPPYMVVHPTKSYPYGTLANGLLYYFKQKGENCIVRLVSRLDMNTSGLIIVAKNQYSHMAMARDMKSEDFEKSYLAVVHGNLEVKEGTINLPIYRPSDDTMKRIVDEKGQESITCFKVLQSYGKGDLVKLTLKTGRTHQIRVHLSHLGYPIFGDTLYGQENDEDFIKRQALHAYRLSFKHPRTGKTIELESELPDDIKELIKKI